MALLLDAKSGTEAGVVESAEMMHTAAIGNGAVEAVVIVITASNHIQSLAVLFL